MSIYRGRVILIAVSSIFLLAVVGIYQLDPQGFVDHPGDSLYRVVQLFFAEGDWTTAQASLPLALQLARFFAPVVAVASLIILFAEGIWAGLINMRVRFYRQHIVIVGLSDAALELIRSCHRRKLPVVVIERDPGNANITICRSLFVPVLPGDAKRTDVLKRSRIASARSLISFIDIDDENVELSLRIQEVVTGARQQNDEPLKVVLQVENMQLGSRLEDYPKFFEYPQQLEVRFFNLAELAARALFREYVPDVYADALGFDQVHVVVVGYGSVGRHVVAKALKQAHYGNSAPLRITVLDEGASSAREAFVRECPAIGIAAEVTFLDLEPTPEVLAQRVEALALNDASMFVASVGSDADNMSMALAIRQLSLLGSVPNAPVFVSLRHSRGLARLVESGQGNPEVPDGLYPFGMVEQLMRVDHMINERVDEIAVALHENYLSGLGQPLDLQSSHRPWSMLAEAFRNDTRAQADHIDVKLRASGHVLVKQVTGFSFDEATVERLAEIEKRRFNAERASQGWTYAEHRSDLAKTHPALKSWQESSATERAFDIASVRQLPAILQERLGMGITLLIIIGITGHRAHRLAQHLDYVERQVREQLQAIQAQYPGCRFAVLSALADGSDRLVADIALDMLGANLFVALPLPYEIYKRSFGHVSHLSNQKSNEEFQRFVGRAQIYFEMPLRFGGVQLLEQDDDLGEQARAKQYALAGAYIVSRSHELLAVWDGQEAKGTGGTAQVVGWRQAGQVDPEYRVDTHFFTPVEMLPPRVISIPADEDD